ncbi:MAG: hypothetical protein IPJ38_09385 [Dechloromonas sp.]|uniref:Uncharacterized protein n=1 Tax=Candidatus Dechloromonas phosphorivorans TaxID=2899244 RepID=A0A935K421_9RHOO|nr:hypothetical protein [Candidatus Dechloromonas phosphorivorans]
MKASGYHFQLRAKSGIQAPLIDEPSLAVSTFHFPKDLAEAKYYWRVATITASEGHGPFSSRIVLRAPRQPPGKRLALSSKICAGKNLIMRAIAFRGTEKDLEKPLIDRVVEQNSLTLDELDAEQYLKCIQTLGATCAEESVDQCAVIHCRIAIRLALSAADPAHFAPL